ncbi:MAG TPA: hypothetical protein VHC47_01940 [Mucilaginibacter sp.]|nr:hypothetical protein [Mucilaginibacter sp.]
MKRLLILTGALFLYAFASNAQVILTPKNGSLAPPPKTTAVKKQKNRFNYDKSVAKANTAATNTNTHMSKTAELLSSTGKAAKGLVKSVGSLIPGNKEKSSDEKVTRVTIRGITFAKLDKLNKDIDRCRGVHESTMKFSSSKGVITVKHSGTTEKLLKQMEKKSKDIFTEDNVIASNEGSISIKLKQGN